LALAALLGMVDALLNALEAFFEIIDISGITVSHFACVGSFFLYKAVFRLRP
jgi:hypothetical protein